MLADIQNKVCKASALSFLRSPVVPVLVGSAVCLWLYCLRDSFWRDESKLLLNVIQKSFPGLIGALDYGQECPLMILWLYRVLYLAGGQSELTFRFSSLLAIISSMWLFKKLALNLLQEKAVVLFVTWIFALSPGVIFFAAQAKHYAMDIFVSTFLLWLASITFFSPVSALRLTWLALAIAIAPWVSLCAIFTIGPLMILILLKSNVPVRRRFGLCLPAGISCLLVLLIVLSRSFSLDKLQLSPPFPVVSAQTLSKKSLGLVFFGYLGVKYLPYLFFWNDVYIALSILALFCSVGIIISFKRYGWGLTVLLASPITMACFLVMLKSYPMLGRAFLFDTPGLYLLAGFGLSFLRMRIPYRKFLCLLSLFLVILPCSRLWLYYSRPVGGVRDALKFISQHHKSGDMVFCEEYSASTVACYQALKNPDANRVNYVNRMDHWIEGKINQSQVSLENLFLPYDNHRLWFLAETEGYARSTNGDLSPFAGKVVVYLEKSRKVDLSYITPRVQAIGFSTVSEKLLHNPPLSGKSSEY